MNSVKKIVVKLHKIEFHKNLFVGSRVVARGQAGRKARGKINTRTYVTSYCHHLKTKPFRTVSGCSVVRLPIFSNTSRSTEEIQKMPRVQGEQNYVALHVGDIIVCKIRTF
jgi:hypothetical protein